MTSPDETMMRIGDGLGLSRRGERAAACRLFAQLWDDIGGHDGDPLLRCAIAHSMADVQDEVKDELVWDLRALEAAGLVTDERVALARMAGTAAGLAPSLHLNTGECYRKLGNADGARDHLRQGREALPALADDEYAGMVREGLDRLDARLRSAGDPARSTADLRRQSVR